MQQLNSIQDSLSGTARIGGIAATLSIAGAIIGAVAYVITKSSGELQKASGDNPMAAMLANNSLLNVIFSLLISAALFYFLYRFSSLTKKALQDQNESQLEAGLLSLATYFRICGVILMVSVGLMVVVVFAAMAGKAFS